MNSIVNLPEFLDYTRVFSRFEIGSILQALLLFRIYPIENFPTLGGFKKRLGFGKDENSSGDRVGEKSGGTSDLSRREFYLWVLTKICPKTDKPLTTAMTRVRAYYEKQNVRFHANPEYYQNLLINRKKEQAVRKFSDGLIENLAPLVGKDKHPLFHSIIASQVQAMDLMLNADIESAAVVDTGGGGGATKGAFGKLIIMKTAAFACKLLYQELRKAAAAVCDREIT